MLKKISLSLIAVLICILPVSANHITSAALNADCNGYTITVGGGTYSQCVVNYALKLISAGQETSTVTGSFAVPIGRFDGYDVYSTFVYNATWQNPLCEDYTISGNIVLVSPNGETQTVELNQVSVVNCSCVIETFCPRTPGYWKNHPEAWPADSLKIGGVAYTKDQLLVMLDASVKGSINIILIKHLIAAKLNILSGAVFNITAVSDADNYLATNVYSKEYAENIKDILDTFNNSGSCD